MSEFDQHKYIKEYQKANYKAVKIRLHKEYDKDIIENLEKKYNKQKYIKDLIRNDIKKAP